MIHIRYITEKRNKISNFELLFFFLFRPYFVTRGQSQNIDFSGESKQPIFKKRFSLLQMNYCTYQNYIFYFDSTNSLQ
jgi:hypothetical protein